MIIFYWLLSIICFLGLIGIIVFPILALVSAIRDSGKPIIQGQKKYSKAIRFVILTVVSFFALVLALVGYGVLSYIFQVMAANM